MPKRANMSVKVGMDSSAIFVATKESPQITTADMSARYAPGAVFLKKRTPIQDCFVRNVYARGPIAYFLYKIIISLSFSYLMLDA